MSPDDPDETEGRKLYRSHADSLARAQVSLAQRKVSLRVSKSDDDTRDTPRLLNIFPKYIS